MASEYNLALKATLDTSQVQQELQRLKNSYTAGSDDGNSFSKGAPGVSHMQKIEVQLTKLNSAISGLQRSIEQLAKQQQRQSGTPGAQTAGNAKGAGATLPIIAGGRTGFQKAAEAEWLKSKQYRELNRQVSEAYSGAVRAGLMRADSPLLKGLGTNEFFHNLIQSNYFQGLTGFDANNYRNLYNKWYKEENALRSLKQQRAAIRQTRQFAMLIGGQLLGGAGELATSLGYEGLGRGISGVGEGITAGAGAGMAASMAGLGGKASGAIGAAVGLAAAFSSLYSSASNASEAIQKMSQQMNEAFKTLHQNTLNVQRSVQETRHQANADMLERTGNIEEARRLATYWKENAQSIQNQFADSDPLAEERRIRERGEARKRNVDKALQEGDVSWLDNDLADFLFHLTGNLDVNDNAQKAKNEVDRQTAEQIAEMQRRYTAMQQDMASAQKQQAVYQGVVDKLEGQQKNELAKSAAEVAARLRLSEANDAAIFGYSTRSQLNQTQDFVNSVLGIKNKGALDKFNAIASELDLARSQKNTALENAFEIARYLKQNEGKIDSAEMQGKQKQQARYDKEAAAIDQRIGILESALTEIQTSTLAPDLSHVTSLAQYGFNMGEKDDGVERMEKYYSKSLNLQQQIKDKLQEGVKTEAVYN